MRVTLLLDAAEDRVRSDRCQGKNESWFIRTVSRASHGRQVHAALAGPRRLVIVPRAGHDDILSYGESWVAIDGFLDEIRLE
jgi:hypothetical protein